MPSRMNIASLINDNTTFDKTDSVVKLKLSNIKKNPYQSRNLFKAANLKELVASIKEIGIIEPVLAKRIGRKFFIIDGERRYRAAKEAGLDDIPAILVHYKDQLMQEVALINNIQAESLNPIEVAQILDRLVNQYKVSKEHLSKTTGKSRNFINQYLNLLQLPKGIQRMIVSNQISFNYAKTLVKLKDVNEMDNVIDVIHSNNLNIKDLEEVIEDINEGRNSNVISKIDERRIEKIFSKKLKETCTVKNDAITITCKNKDTLEKLLKLLD